MMKLRRPLCSDVTLRLAVDLTPDEEYCFHGNRDDDDTKNENTTAHQDTLTSSCEDNRRHDFGNNNSSSRHDHSSSGSGCTGVTCSSGRGGHTFNWYSRQNTPDKTAKDIYNHEHFLTDTKLYSTVALDSEFKRHVEEEGNDFKDVKLYNEIDCDKIRKSSSPTGINSNEEDDDDDDSITKDDEDEVFATLSDERQSPPTPTGSHPKRGSPCFADAELSGCFTDARLGEVKVRETCSRFLTSLPQTGLNGNHKPLHTVATSSQDTSNNNNNNNNNNSNKNNSGTLPQTVRANTRNCLDLEQELRQASVDQEAEVEEDIDDGDLEEEDDDDDDDDIDDFVLSDVDLPEAPAEIPVDMDEDVDEGMEVMDPSLVMSVHGELCELDPLYTPVAETELDPGQKVEDVPDEMMKSIAEEIHDVLIDGEKEVTGVETREGEPLLHSQLPFHYPFTMKHVGYLFDKSRHHFTSAKSEKPKRASRASKSQLTCKTTRASPSYAQRISFTNPPPAKKEEQGTQDEDLDLVAPHNACGSARVSVSTMTSPQHLPVVTDMEVTHRGLHRFIPRHHDEINIGIGDPIHVIKEYDDLWCEGINLATNERGIFPAMYANDLKFLDDSDDDEEEYWKFNMKFLGSMEVTAHKGDDVLLYAINKIAKSHQGTIHNAAVCILEINQYGIRMIDKSKDGHEKDTFSHFFALKNISFCGTHPKDNRYFAFITKHPRDYKFACHVFHGNRPTHRARDALGEAFKRFYQEYMAFTHPTEDIYIE